jgi:uncharacterized protein YbaP (TraB family)
MFFKKTDQNNSSMKKIKTLVSNLIVKMFADVFAGRRMTEKLKEFDFSDRFSLLWEITGNGLQQPSYLFGTIHIYDPAVFKIPEEVYTAIERCKSFALEIDDDRIKFRKLLRKILISDPEYYLDKLLEPEIYDEIQKLPFIQKIGKLANRMKPFYLQPYLFVNDPHQMQSVETNLKHYAKQKFKKIRAIETVGEQLEILDSISIQEQAQMIKTIYNYCKQEQLGFAEAGKKLYDTIQITYKEQDFDKLVNLENEFRMTSSPSFYSSLIGYRNVRMANRIDNFIKRNKTLFAGLGAMHLPDYKNMSGVVALLKEKGYELRPVLIDLNI